MMKRFWEGWKRFGRWIGDMLARVVLTMFYFTIFLPFGLGVRLFADPLMMKDRSRPFWLPRQTNDTAMADVLRQF